MAKKNYYKTLGVESSASQDEIKAAYRKLVRQYHPDKNSGREEFFKQIQEAYETLSDERKRDTYDAKLAYENYTSDPIELAKFLRDQKNKPKKYKPPVIEEEEEEEFAERKPVFNSTVALILGIVVLIAGANVVILKDKIFPAKGVEKSESGKHSDYMPDASSQKLLDEYFVRAMKYFHEKNFEFALLYFSKAFEVAPNEPKLFFNRGLCYYASKNFSAALDDLNKTIQLNPSYKNAYWIRAKLKYDMDNNESAIADFTEAIKLDPKNDSLYFNRGLAYYYMSDFQSAIKDIDKAIELNPNQPQYYFDRGDAKEMMGDETGTCNDWLKAKEMGYSSPELNKKPCLSGPGS